MAWQQWVLIVGLALNVVLSISIIGKPRQPMTPGAAAFGTVVNALLIWLIVSI